MRVTGRVVNGRVEVEKGVEFPEGAVAEIAIGDEESAGRESASDPKISADLHDEQHTASEVLREGAEEELLRRLREVEAGEYITADEVIAELLSMRSR